MLRKLAIAIGSAVSFGSYEVGVMYKVLDAINRLNQNFNSQV